MSGSLFLYGLLKLSIPLHVNLFLLFYCQFNHILVFLHVLHEKELTLSPTQNISLKESGKVKSSIVSLFFCLC